MTAVTFAATLDRILNGLTRPFFGWVSDQIGRENTMFIAFALEGVGIYLLHLWGHDPIWFVILSGCVFFAWGEIYSLFPSTCTDTFGTKYAATNAGLLYTAKGTAALLVPFANTLQQQTGSWDMVLIVAAGANILASLLAIGVLKPWRAGGSCAETKYRKAEHSPDRHIDPWTGGDSAPSVPVTCDKLNGSGLAGAISHLSGSNCSRVRYSAAPIEH